MSSLCECEIISHNVNRGAPARIQVSLSERITECAGLWCWVVRFARILSFYLIFIIIIFFYFGGDGWGFVFCNL